MKIVFQNLGLLFISLALISGCARVKETVKCAAGISTKNIEEGRKDAIKMTFACDLDTCFNKTRKALLDRGSYIYAQGKKKDMIAIYLSETDTTSVGLFFKAVDSTHTQIEFSSPSSYAKELVSKRIYYFLENIPEPVAEDGDSGLNSLFKK